MPMDPTGDQATGQDTDHGHRTIDGKRDPPMKSIRIHELALIVHPPCRPIIAKMQCPISAKPSDA